MCQSIAEPLPFDHSPVACGSHTNRLGEICTHGITRLALGLFGVRLDSRWRSLRFVNLGRCLDDRSCDRLAIENTIESKCKSQNSDDAC